MLIVKQLLNAPDLMLIQALTQFVRVTFAKTQAAWLVRKYVDREFVIKLLEFLDIGNEEIKLNVTWSLANIASTYNTVMEILMPLNVHVKMIELLKTEPNKIKEQCLWTLANIAGDCPEARDELIKVKIIEQLSNILSKQVVNIYVLENTTWLITNLSKDISLQYFSEIKEIIECFSSLLYVTNDNVVGNILWAISYLTEVYEDYAKAVIENINPKRIIQLLECDIPEFKLLAIKIIGNICSLSDSGTEDFVECGCVEALEKVISGNNDVMFVKEACWTLSNIAADSQFTSAIITLASTLIWLVKSSEDYTVKQEATWVLVNACSVANLDQLLTLTQKGTFNMLILMLNDKDLEMSILKTVNNALRVGSSAKENEIAKEWELAGGLTKLSDLQLSKNNEVYGLVVETLEQFYSHEEILPFNSSQ